MMNLLSKKIGMVLIVAACVVGCFAMGASAQEIGTSQLSERVSISVQNQEIQPRRDIIEMKYRIYNGITQQRRWNRTANRWVDPYWINC